MFPKYLNPIEANSVLELAFGLIVALFFWPIGLIIYCVNVSLRSLSQIACNYFYPGRYIIAAGEDSVFGVKLPGTSHSIIHGYKIIEGEADINRVRSKFRELFSRTRGYDKLKYAFTHKFGYFCWDTQPQVPFDVNKHIRLLDDFDPEEIVDEGRLTDMLTSIASREYSDDEPAWEILMIPRFRVGGESELINGKTSHYALIVRIHHAFCDGVSYVLLINNFLADSPGELPLDPMKEFKNPMWIKIYIWAKLLMIGPANFLTNLIKLIINPSIFRVRKYNTTKIMGKSSKVEMDMIRRIRMASGSSVTSITLSAVFAALYKAHMRLYPGKPVLPNQKLHLGSVGVMLPYTEDNRLANQFTMWPYTAPLKVDDPKERLQMTLEEVRRCASQPDAVFDFYMQRALGSLPKFLHEILFNLSGTPVMLSNVPGYKTPVKIFGGTLKEAGAWIPLVTTTGIGLSTQTYCGRMHFSAITDPQIFPTKADLEIFLEDVVKEIHIIAEAYGVDGQEEEFLAAMLLKRNTKPNLQAVSVKDTNDNEQLIKSVLSIESPKPVLENSIQLGECRIRKADSEGEKVHQSSQRIQEKVI